MGKHARIKCMLSFQFSCNKPYINMKEKYWTFLNLKEHPLVADIEKLVCEKFLQGTYEAQHIVLRQAGGLLPSWEESDIIDEGVPLRIELYQETLPQNNSKRKKREREQELCVNDDEPVKNVKRRKTAISKAKKNPDKEIEAPEEDTSSTSENNTSSSEDTTSNEDTDEQQVSKTKISVVASKSIESSSDEEMHSVSSSGDSSSDSISATSMPIKQKRVRRRKKKVGSKSISSGLNGTCTESGPLSKSQLPGAGDQSFSKAPSFVKVKGAHKSKGHTVFDSGSEGPQRETGWDKTDENTDSLQPNGHSAQGKSDGYSKVNLMYPSTPQTSAKAEPLEHPSEMVKMDGDNVMVVSKPRRNRKNAQPHSQSLPAASPTNTSTPRSYMTPQVKPDAVSSVAAPSRLSVAQLDALPACTKPISLGLKVAFKTLEINPETCVPEVSSYKFGVVRTLNVRTGQAEVELGPDSVTELPEIWRLSEGEDEQPSNMLQITDSEMLELKVIP